MTERTFIVIFFFWAILTIVTPTLILLSESSKPDWKSSVDRSRGMVNAGRTSGYAEIQLARKVTRSAPMEEAPAPAPFLEPVLRTRWTNLRRIFKKRL
ncbi:uncharacterized protein LOC8288951 [Ricinus communis]|uniref:Uncharacterized protein n=1 Tax=Ricinus communis TaxID=3988 RepID=B9R7W6_RICCO|nr:uncharacterized protein LOC8288951 [Ricinus communis]EEF52596.1 conserved hypothetical protein [Ricinus communis]|eukprot:XP_002510409.1 uncharacterized protein LOC8288951 [Ricinus communis]